MVLVIVVSQLIDLVLVGLTPLLSLLEFLCPQVPLLGVGCIATLYLSGLAIKRACDLESSSVVIRIFHIIEHLLNFSALFEFGGLQRPRELLRDSRNLTIQFFNLLIFLNHKKLQVIILRLEHIQLTATLTRTIDGALLLQLNYLHVQPIVFLHNPLILLLQRLLLCVGK